MTHCTLEKRREILNEPRKRRVVCSNHFLPLTPKRLTAAKGTEYLKTEWCGSAWMMKSGRSQPSRRRNSAHSQDSEAIQGTQIDVPAHFESISTSKVSSTSECSPPKSPKFERDLSVILNEIEEQQSSEMREKARTQLLHSSIGMDLVLSAVCAVVNNLMARSGPTQSCRTGLKAVFDVMDDMQITYNKKKMSYYTGMSARTIQRAHVEHEQVRN